MMKASLSKFSAMKIKIIRKVKNFSILFLGLMLFLVLFRSASGQSESYQIGVRKNFGYDMGNTIQGRFTVRLLGDAANVTRVIFYLDGEILGEVNSEPFQYSFRTDDFAPGVHRLSAEVQLADSSRHQTPELPYHFLSSEEASQQTIRLFVWIGGAILGTMLLVGLIQWAITKKKPSLKSSAGLSQNYGMFGGAICPRCGRTFPRHIWGINLVVGKLDRCEHCGKWFLATRATPDALRAAEESGLDDPASDEIIPSAIRDQNEGLEDTKFFDNI